MMLDFILANINILLILVLITLYITSFIQTNNYITKLESDSLTQKNKKYNETTSLFPEHLSKETMSSRILIIKLLFTTLLLLLVLWGNIIFLNTNLQKIGLFFIRIFSSERLFINKEDIFNINTLRGHAFFYLMIYFVNVFINLPFIVFLIGFLLLYFNQSYIMNLLIPNGPFSYSLLSITLSLPIFYFFSLLINFLVLYLMVINSEEPPLSADNRNLIKENFDYLVYVEESKLNFANGFIFNKSVFIVIGDSSSISDEEVYACILHEIGHRGPFFIFLFFVLQCFFAIFTFFLNFLLVDYFVSYYFNNEPLKFTLLVVNLPIFYSFFEILTRFFSFFSEYSADSFVKDKGFSDHLVKGLVKISYMNMVPNFMSFITNLLVSSHPNNYYRIRNLYNEQS